jgi:nicotinamidase/pyrazinamidase
MSKKALLVIDMLHDFMDPSGVLYCGDEARKIIPVVKELIEEHRRSHSIVVFPCDTHEPNDKEFEMFAPHCVAGTPGAALIPELEIKAGEYLVPKTRYSALYGSDLEKILIEEGVTEVHMCGVCTSICVMDTASDLRNRDYTVIMHEKAVADFDPAAHEFALKRMRNILGARIEP